ncbi:4a-hydroxytetrahydrobiopterin dehydratase [Paenarthrobacter sp. Z7-10]|uniref:4a-hydroxytetrahydrobiopterin dehydratase n=1 Tax=Paenarthrobacter sp. Z7-10 TaxID=2787635 RepID=UPI0022A97F73|nr:4a-hydroxytetrahydrobiopterin dehydratase [Paenarthrobacter sp. Z7-10]MCZ2403225.1 4a-hydroxytetrahydrobiopterin dehydratase [Paenarthrobacter sp. Z7-10]
MSAADVLTQTQIEDQLAALPYWRYRPTGLAAVFKLPTARAALDLLARIGDLAEHANHHPDVDWRYNRLLVTLISHDAGDAITSRDMELARQISAAGRNAGATAEPDHIPE